MEPGLYLISSDGPSSADAPPLAGLQRAGPFWVGGAGLLFTRAKNEQAQVLFEGLLTHGGRSGRSDAETMLSAFCQAGLAGLEELSGFFRAIVVDLRRQVAHLLGDTLATRPQYLLRLEGLAATAPEAGALRAIAQAHGQRLSLDRQGLYETIRLYHPIAGRTLIAEIQRAQPLTRYAFKADGKLDAIRPARISKEPDESLDLDRAATRIRDLQRDILGAILAHPMLEDRPICLPLTAGQDSRHLLGELLAQDKRPARLAQVYFKDAEMRPVKAIADFTGIPLDLPRPGELDWPALGRRWVARTHGLLHHHQIYLLQMGEIMAAERPIGFDGYLADHYFGLNRRPGLPDQRNFAPLACRLLFGEHVELAGRYGQRANRLFETISGPEDFRVRVFDSFTRGVYYTGGAFPFFGQDGIFFAPAAHRLAFDFCRQAPEATVAFKRARLQMYKRYFPQLANFPGESGVPLIDLEVVPHKVAPVLPDAVVAARGMLSAHLWDPAPGTVHEWLRRIKPLRRTFQLLAADSQLQRDHHLRRLSLSSIWRAHRLGGFFARTLQGLLSAEVAYRSLVHGESQSDICEALGFTES